MKKSKSESKFNVSIDEIKEFTIEDIKKDALPKPKPKKQAVRRSHFTFSCCLFYQSDKEETIDISLKPNFGGN